MTAEEKKFKNGNKVVMFDCMEAKHIDNYGKIWDCSSDSFMSASNSEVVFLKGFSGCFSCEFLQLVLFKAQLRDELISFDKYCDNLAGRKHSKELTAVIVSDYLKLKESE